jgi:hypothetical protein
MNPVFLSVDWIAIGVGAVLAYFIGWLWYSRRLFGKDWEVGVGLETTSTSATYGDAIVAQAFGTFLLSWVVGVAEAMQNPMLAILVAFSIAALMRAKGFFTKNSRYATAVDSGFVLIMVLVMMLVHAVL